MLFLFKESQDEEQKSEDPAEEYEGKTTKVYLTRYVADHPLWQDRNMWLICVQRVINQKFHEAVKTLEK